ncbi:Band 4.1-like protein 3 [Portunus trituberculatus]|uniref:Band 4.1-like protein 3 n=1 Tax=Portunus trituberculatus TaxID=210409 RepID=A0A5B7FWE4_PORTR|nr:Band 4.1-like protein 3 [Portunus trituberculatus]
MKEGDQGTKKKTKRGIEGQTPADAEFNFLDHAKRLDMYGVDLHKAKDSTNREIHLGVTSIGLVVLQNGIKMNTFSWAKIPLPAFHSLAQSLPAFPSLPQSLPAFPSHSQPSSAFPSHSQPSPALQSLPAFSNLPQCLSFSPSLSQPFPASPCVQNGLKIVKQILWQHQSGPDLIVKGKLTKDNIK